MVFHNIVNFTDVISGHRYIIYYIESELCENSAETLTSSLKSILESLGKKNDDLLLIKISKSSDQFRHFQAIYKTAVCDGITLFVVNDEGIPVTSLFISSEKEILLAISSLIKICGLTTISNIESIIDSFRITRNVADFNSTQPHNTNVLKPDEPILHSPSEDFTGSTLGEDSVSEPKRPRLSSENDDCVSTSTKLQIRLPDGSKDVQKFDKEALLNEVHSFITSKHKLKDFELKTFNRQHFAVDDYEKTLLDLGLHPNGVIIVVLKKQVVLNGNGGIVDFVQTGVLQLITSTTSLIRFVQDFLFKIWMNFFSSTNSAGNGSNSILNSQNARLNLKQSSIQKKSKHSKPFGNIHTLRRNDDPDDENNRYNGNSTQQK